jgi:hypothetical protein
MSSRDIAGYLGVNPWQIRKDFSYFGSFGTPGASQLVFLGTKYSLPSQSLWRTYAGAPGSKVREKSFGAQVGKISARPPKFRLPPKRFFSQCVTGHFGFSESTTNFGTLIDL